MCVFCLRLAADECEQYFIASSLNMIDNVFKLFAMEMQQTFK